MKSTRSPTSRAKPISWVTTTIVMPPAASSRITSSTSFDQLGVEGAGDLVEQHRLAAAWRARARWRRAAAGRPTAARGARRPCRRGPPAPAGLGPRVRGGRGSCPSTVIGARATLSSDGPVGEEVERLEDHPDPAAQGVHRRPGGGELVVAQEDAARRWAAPACSGSGAASTCPSPEGPMTHTTSPGATSRSTPPSTCCGRRSLRCPLRGSRSWGDDLAAARPPLLPGDDPVEQPDQGQREHQVVPSPPRRGWTS